MDHKAIEGLKKEYFIPCFNGELHIPVGHFGQNLLVSSASFARQDHQKTKIWRFL